MTIVGKGGRHSSTASGAGGAEQVMRATRFEFVRQDRQGARPTIPETLLASATLLAAKQTLLSLSICRVEEQMSPSTYVAK
jgi:hypothetical protein